MINHCTCSTRFHLVLSAPYPDSLGGEEPVAAVRRGLCGRPQWPPGSDACEAAMASALATPHTATRPSSLSSSFGLSSSLSFVIMLLFWLFWLFWLVLLGFAFCSAFCSSSIFFRNSALLFALSFVSPLSGMRECGPLALPHCASRSARSLPLFPKCPRTQMSCTFRLFF